MAVTVQRRPYTNGEANRLHPEDRAFHEWYRFVLSYPPHLVREYLERFRLTGRHAVLDPFCGTGTTLVECKKLGIPSIGAEANPMAYFASRTKLDWRPDPDGLVEHARRVADTAQDILARQGVADVEVLFQETPPRHLLALPSERAALLLTNSISPLPLHKTLVLLEALHRHRDDRFFPHERLALAKAIVHSIGNLQFGPEVGVGPPKPDAAVIAPWLSGVRAMALDLRAARRSEQAEATVSQADARELGHAIAPQSVDAVITSPPYPNEKDYTRTTRLESVLLGFVRSKPELRALKAGLVRSNTRGVYKGDDDDRWVAGFRAVQRIADEIEARRIALGKTSGFERQYARVTRLYFGGMAKHLASLRPILRPSARLAYVVGDQASYLRVMIRTGHLLAEIAEHLGYEVVGIDLFRTRLATATREQLREEVLVLRWPGRRE
jgi:DNA modification methylase